MTLLPKALIARGQLRGWLLASFVGLLVGTVPAHAQSPKLVAAQNKTPAPIENIPPSRRQLRIPEGLPGADAESIQMPGLNDPVGRRAAIDRIFPPLPPIEPAIECHDDQHNPALSLDEAIGIGLSQSPDIHQAMALVRANCGEAVQAGLHPNPTLGYEGDTIGTLGTAGYHGPFVTQTVKTAGKLQMARSSLMFNVRKAELNVQKTRVTIAANVTARYYDVVVAAESMCAAEALTRFTDEAYRVQLELLRGGEAAVYEPMQLRTLTMQARAQLLMARNRYLSALKQLAAAMSVGDMPPTKLIGDAKVELPAIDYAALESQTLARHPDILAARYGVQQARLDVRRAEIVPVPDVNLYSTVQKDYTGPPFGTTVNVQASIPVPVFDRNTGGIIQAQGLINKAVVEEARVRNQMQTNLAAAYERYQNNRGVVHIYRYQITPDLARAYRAIYDRYQQEPDKLNIGDVVVAQQSLATATQAYLQALDEQWRATADLLNAAQLMRPEELYSFGGEPVRPAPPAPLAGPQNQLDPPPAPGGNAPLPPRR
ncbi:MAG: TolC family protein [Planctomycetaceae bacterium]|nr:TolC family protein [Planctomycetaceae bacterium]